MAKRRNLDLYGPFVLHSLEMLESYAWRALSNEGRRLLSRLEVEHMQQGGAANGHLVCTYDDFERAGIRRKFVPLAIQQCVALGFLEVTLKGGFTRADIKWPSRYRLTYVMGRSKSPDPIHEWKRIKAPKVANGEAKPTRLRGAKPMPGEIFSPGAKTPLRAEGAKTPLQPGGQNAPTGPGAKTPLLSISREGVPHTKRAGNGGTPPLGWHKPVIEELPPEEAAEARERLRDVRSWHEEHGRN